MQLRRARTWRLYIDESGQFTGDAPSAVVGLLIGTELGQEHEDLNARLRRELESAVPETPWPLHSTELNQGSYLLARWRMRNYADQRRSPAYATLASLWAAIEHAQSDDLRRFAADVVGGSQIDYARLEQINITIQRMDPLGYERLRARVEQIRDSVRTVITSLQAQDPPDLLTMFAAISLRDEESVTAESDRYLLALTTLFERVFQLLRSGSNRSDELTIWVIAARRSVNLTPSLMIPLHVNTVTSAIRLAEQTLPLAPPPGRPDGVLRLVAEPVVDYRLNPEAGLVLVDAVANRIGRILRAGTYTWPTLQNAIEKSTGLRAARAPSLGRSTPALPTVSAPSPWREQLQQWLRAGSTAQDKLPPSPRWSTESTRLFKPWVESLR